MNDRARGLGWPVGVAALTLLVWELLGVRGLGVNTVVLPAPSVVVRVLFTRSDLMLEHLWPTFYQIVLGFLISVAGGILVAVLITYSRIVRNGFYPACGTRILVKICQRPPM